MLGPGCVELETVAMELYDTRVGHRSKLEHLPVIHVVRGAGRWLPFLAAPDAAPVVCISDWQYERATQRQFWEAALPIVQDACGGEEALANALMLIAGDMASAADELRGTSSDAVPDLVPFASCLGPQGTLLFVYGNHDDEVQAPGRNGSGLSQLLPDGEAVYTNRDSGAAQSGHADEPSKQVRWGKNKEESKKSKAYGLRVGGVHGIPSSQEVLVGSLWKKRARDIYFRQVRQVCSDADVVVVHSNPKLPGQEEVEGPDGPALLRAFMQGSGKLLVHGHMHTQEVVTVVSDARVVVNSDCRVVILLPGAPSGDDVSTATPSSPDLAAADLALPPTLSPAAAGDKAAPGEEVTRQADSEEAALEAGGQAKNSCNEPRRGRWRGKGSQEQGP